MSPQNGLSLISNFSFSGRSLGGMFTVTAGAAATASTMMDRGSDQGEIVEDIEDEEGGRAIDTGGR